jgi:hypothetical protein
MLDDQCVDRPNGTTERKIPQQILTGLCFRVRAP